MFTGIVEAVGVVRSFIDGVLEIEAPKAWADRWRIGESVAIDGCCLTVVAIDPCLRFDVSPETLAKTTMGTYTVGRRVNLERAMRADGRFGGHIVQGHVDGTAEIAAVVDNGNGRTLTIRLKPAEMRRVIEKGSVTLDGISLTVVAPGEDTFEVWAIPHTLAATTLGEAEPGRRMNVEFDLVGRWIERFASVSAPA